MTIASISIEAFASSLAGLIAAITAFAAYRTNVRQKQSDEALKVAGDNAELAKTEVAGWKALIETLTAQYKSSMHEQTLLRDRLIEGNRRFEVVNDQLLAAKIATAEGLVIIKRLESEVRDLRAQIDRLMERLSMGAERDVRRVEQRMDAPGFGKGERGATGASGATGERGERGEKGEDGEGERGERGKHGDTGQQGIPGTSGHPLILPSKVDEKDDSEEQR